MYRKLFKDYIAASNNSINKKNFLSLYPDAHSEIFTSIDIYNSFRGAGLKPLNLEHILSKLIFQLCTPTLPLIKGSIFSAFQTL